MAEDWNTIAQDEGYPTEGEMWQGLYQNLSIPQLASRFNCSTSTILRHLHAAGCEMRGRGGPNNTKYTQQDADARALDPLYGKD